MNAVDAACLYDMKSDRITASMELDWRLLIARSVMRGRINYKKLRCRWQPAQCLRKRRREFSVCKL